MYFIGYLYQYVDYHMGAESGYVRFEQPEMVQKPRAAAVLAEEGGLVVKNYIAVLEAVEGKALKKMRGNKTWTNFTTKKTTKHD